MHRDIRLCDNEHEVCNVDTPSADPKTACTMANLRVHHARLPPGILAAFPSNHTLPAVIVGLVAFLLEDCNGFSRVQTLGAAVGAVHDAVAPVQLHGVVNPGQALLGELVTGIRHPPVRLHEHGRTQVVLRVPPVRRARCHAARTQDALVHAIQFCAVILGLQKLPLTLGLGLLALQPRLNGLVVVVEVGKVRDQILDDIGMGQGLDLDGFGRRFNVQQACKPILAVDVHGTRTTDALTATSSESQSGIHLVLDLDQPVQHHGAASRKIDVVLLQTRLPSNLGVISVDLERLGGEGASTGNRAGSPRNTAQHVAAWSVLQHLSRRRVVVIDGEEGVGKTAVAEAVARFVVARGQTEVCFVPVEPSAPRHTWVSLLTCALRAARARRYSNSKKDRLVQFASRVISAGIACESNNTGDVQSALPSLLRELSRTSRPVIFVLDGCDHLTWSPDFQRGILAILRTNPKVQFLLTSAQPMLECLGSWKVVHSTVQPLAPHVGANLFLRRARRALRWAELLSAPTTEVPNLNAPVIVRDSSRAQVLGMVANHPLLRQLGGNPRKLVQAAARVTPSLADLRELMLQPELTQLMD
eukprot:CAMPEP_0204468360 /NCGR_PEP_ID=MMETSP0471-20130131/10450_1 /ASSEMBLY_ACC=CAM_ASM_000602 /TAXON_ID=2969 /ORGANISM="Oxyrrhis marina" /LENGTH=586 /DNA_ID=CAMNT_0051470169 /DNA_START=118 /DNA_END=1878 /DNA_ORIENTATION=-